MTQTELLKILKSMYENSQGIARIMKGERKTALANRFKGETDALYTVITMLEHPEYAERMRQIYLKED